MDFSSYFQRLNSAYASGVATEHSYRPALDFLFKGIDPGLTVVNEPQRLTDVGAPDFSFLRGDVLIGNAEAKIIGADLRNLKNREKDQRDRYLKALPNLIYTDGLEFLFYRDARLVHDVRIGSVLMGIHPEPDRFGALEHGLREFAAQTPITITKPEVLARLMAGKAALIKDILARSLIADADQKTDLAGQYQAFRDQLIHDISIEDFAGMYAETIAYGMFAARLHDTTLEDFSREEARRLLPKSNPFLRELFRYVADDLDERLVGVVDGLAQVFRACDVKALMEGFGKLTGRADPFLHFYETFLGEYDPAKKKARGVWYTPEPVVNFIVRAVDEVLQTEFGLPMGLADTSKVTLDWDTGQTDAKGRAITIKKDVHRVQILDPATGTGTFLAEVIKQIAPKIQGIAPGMWSHYIEDHLIPRLNGFELLMASYAMCHMKLDMILSELGYVRTGRSDPTGKDFRLNVYLTNSLEEGAAANQTLPFAQWLSKEVREANTIKRDMPIMCVIGNPPYNNSSQNHSVWIREALIQYKDGLEEKKINLDDDYIKFFRLSDVMIERSGQGVVAMITNNSFLSGVTHRVMRNKLLRTFDKLFILNLHGDSNKKETSPDGSPDVNVFDIMQGVAITLMVRLAPHRRLPEPLVFYADMYGTRQSKYDRLFGSSAFGELFSSLQPSSPYYFLTPKDFKNAESYSEGVHLGDLMPLSNTGVKTDRDLLFLDYEKAPLKERISRLLSRDFDGVFAEKYNVKNSGSFKIIDIIKRVNFDSNNLSILTYRPFDFRNIYYDPTLVSRAGYKAMKHMRFENMAFVLPKYATEIPGALVVNGLVGHKSFAAYDINYAFPLYLYPDEQDLDQSRRVNFDPKLYARLQSLATHPAHGTPDEVAVFDYIYGVLHCPAYRATYAEFLKIDFPRIPWPKTPDAFWDIAGKGGMLRRLHLMEPAAIGPTPYPFEGQGDGIIDKPRFEDGRVWINATQSFANAPEVAWGFYIGGYQPAQKWLKDRKGRQMGFDDIQHYQRILKILSETDRIMTTIEMDLT
ncbi:MAG: type ISP restriction/modification enzyme [Roseicyclus sp.]|uniref:type ISP restriction/modification enzyme n=1 Tax=Roseicyclus sp. TaxID=1914329 RepID=UPI003A86339B